jgi:sigma-B regulation protein RsbU (phosphoserine phosphatase)
MPDPARQHSRRRRLARAGDPASNRDARGTSASRRTRPGVLEAALEQIDEGVVIADTQGRFIFWNAAARRMVGQGPIAAPPSEWTSVYGCFFPDAVTPYPPEQLPLARAIRGEYVHETVLFVRSPKAPGGTWINVNGGPLVGPDGTVLGGVIVFRDVTVRRRSEELVRQLSQAVEKTTDAVFITDAASVIQYVNPAFETMTRYSREQAVGRPASLLKSGWQDRGFYRAMWESILAGRVHSATLVNRRKDGTFFHAEQTITPVPDEQGHISRFVSVMRDVTAIKRAHEREVEMRLARTVQQKLYPNVSPALPGFDIAGAAFPADHTCGDYYDVLRLPCGLLIVAVGDVSGHGFGAALLMAETRAYLRSLAQRTSDLGEILAALNTFLLEDTEDQRFVTLMLARLDPEERTVSYASAGHINGYAIDGNGATKLVLVSTSPPLGLFPDAVFPTKGALPLETGDTLVLLTDGVTETENRKGEAFEAERALRCVAEARGESAGEIVRRLHAAVMAFAAEEPQRDDITAVVCRVRP